MLSQTNPLAFYPNNSKTPSRGNSNTVQLQGPYSDRNKTLKGDYNMFLDNKIYSDTASYQY